MSAGGSESSGIHVYLKYQCWIISVIRNEFPWLLARPLFSRTVNHPNKECSLNFANENNEDTTKRRIIGVTTWNPLVKMGSEFKLEISRHICLLCRIWAKIWFTAVFIIKCLDSVFDYQRVFSNSTVNCCRIALFCIAVGLAFMKGEVFGARKCLHLIVSWGGRQNALIVVFPLFTHFSDKNVSCGYLLITRCSTKPQIV